MGQQNHGAARLPHLGGRLIAVCMILTLSTAWLLPVATITGDPGAARPAVHAAAPDVPGDEHWASGFIGPAASTCAG